METLILLIRLARPHFLLGGILLYALGAGIARYLGAPIDAGLYLLGQLWVSLMQLSTHFLNEYFNAQADLDNPNRTPFSGGSGVIGPGKLPRAAALWGAIATLTAVSSFTFMLLVQGHVDMVTLLVMVLIFLGAFFYAVPPVRLESSGYGELTTSFLVASLVPAFALLLQYGELHRLLPMVTFPLTFLHLAMILALELPDYSTDLKHEKRTMMVRMGWENGMRLHNVSIVSAYTLLALAFFLGLPFWLALPAMLTIVLGFFQIWLMYQISSGSRPNWTALTLTATATFGVTAYLLAFAFWTN